MMQVSLEQIWRLLLRGCTGILAQKSVGARIPLVNGIIHAEASREFGVAASGPEAGGFFRPLQNLFQALCDNSLFTRLHHPGDNGHPERRSQSNDAWLAFLQ